MTNLLMIEKRAMNIGILAVDSNYPNLALMKISAWHKARGDNVEWYNPLCSYDKVYSAKVFSFTPDYGYYINTNQIEKGGTGYDISKVLPVEVDKIVPDYNLYNIDKNLAYGSLPVAVLIVANGVSFLPKKAT